MPRSAQNDNSVARMINHIPAVFYADLVARDSPVSCDGGNCDVNGTAGVNAAKDQWNKFSQGAKIGIIVGAAVGATLLLSVVACCLWRCCRRRQGTRVRFYCPLTK